MKQLPNRNCISFLSRESPAPPVTPNPSHNHSLMHCSDGPIPSASPTAVSPTAQVKKAPETPAKKGKKELAALVPTVAPKAMPAPEIQEILTREVAELHLFDISTGTFVLQEQRVTATVSEVGQWQCRFPL